LFTTASSDAVYTTTPGQKSSTKNKTTLDLKAKKSRKPAATERRRTSQRLSGSSKETAVPSSRVGRLLNYSGMFVDLNSRHLRNQAKNHLRKL